MDLTDFLTFAIEREKIRLKKEAGQPAPWTEDPELQRGYFCNVFREDDRTTRWFREHIRDHVSGGQAIFACTVFRWFNLPAAGEVLIPHLRDKWRPLLALREMEKLPSVVSGAYMVKSPKGMGKAEGILAVADQIRPAAMELGEKRWFTMESLHAELLKFPFVGRFIAYEIVTDLRHTDVLRDATDIMTWASAGPGCARGLNWLTGRGFRYGPEKYQQQMLECMREILEEVNRCWVFNRPWEMREVEHVLCEYDKYKRLQSGARPKRYYRRKT